jgi:arylsulfatase A-like enzyme
MLRTNLSIGLVTALATVMACSRLPQAVGTGSPRLVVLISVDQMRPDQLDRLADHLDPNGLGRFLDRGRRFTEAALPYASTSTGPGHASLGTGTLPRHHGITDNTMWIRQTGTNLYCFGDSTAQGVGNNGTFPEVGGQRSAVNAQRPALGEHLQDQFPGAKVVSIAGKDRSAIGMGGATADPCLWWERSAGQGLVTSTAYRATLPEWVQEWNNGWIAAANGWTWTADTLNPNALPPGTEIDDRAGEGNLFGQGRAFPYSLPTADPAIQAQRVALAEAVYRTTYVDSIVLQAAILAMDKEQLGQDATPDLLCLGFAATDTVGHNNGPYSHEVTDNLLRLDSGLARFFSMLDERLGAENWVAALTSDHGVLPLPEGQAGQAIGATRVTTAEITQLTASVRRRIKTKYGETFGVTATAVGVTLNPTLMAAAGVDGEAVRKVAADGLAEEFPWIDQVFTQDQILEPLAASDSEVLRHFKNGAHVDRGVDLRFLLVEGTLAVTWGTGTSHGSAHGYDRGLPLLLLGPGVKVGTDDRPCASHDIAPTLLHLLGVAAPAIEAMNFDGSSLID